MGAAVAGPILAGALAGFAWGLGAPSGLRLALGWRLASMLVVPGLVVGLCLAPFALALTPSRRASIDAWVLARGRLVAAVALVAPPLCVVWAGLAAFAGRVFMTAFHHVGLAAMAQSAALLALTVGALAVGAALVAWVARKRPEPATVRAALWLPLAAGVVVAALIFAHGVFWGDDQGRSRGLALFMGGYGVLKKPELDLTPVLQLLAVVLGGVALAVMKRRFGLAALASAAVVSLALLGASAARFGDSEAAAIVDARPSLPRVVLRGLRRATDRDHDGFARYFGGGDCDDRRREVNPDAVDLPGNGVDEDCSGRDATRAARRPTPAPTPTPTTEPSAPPPPRVENLVLITVDTLRWDTHYAGNPNPITPNIDRLAAQSVVLDRGYALSSYTGRAIGPMMTGRYPTECPRDAEHFTRYTAPNVFLAERLKDSGFHTFGAASHFYFEPRFGLAQGMDTWDLSARPGGDGQETTSADHRVADRAIALLQDPANTRGRFFLWVHFFDPHKQYVDHPELPLFGRGERARYDREVMWSDRQVGRVLDALDALPGEVSARTAVVLTADHGEAFAEHGMSWHGVELWEELVRVPWLFRVPGVAPRHISTPRSQVDLAPTLCDLLGITAPTSDAPDAFSGQSLAGELRGAEATPRPVYIELPEGPYNSLRRSVIDRGWKLTERGARRFELYDLTTDPGERTNLAATRPDELARMRAVMEEVRSSLRPVTAAPRR
ncbi:MAG: sulfatase [Polyangiales bacterium]